MAPPYSHLWINCPFLNLCYSLGIVTERCWIFQIAFTWVLFFWQNLMQCHCSSHATERGFILSPIISILDYNHNQALLSFHSKWKSNGIFTAQTHSQVGCQWLMLNRTGTNSHMHVKVPYTSPLKDTSCDFVVMLEKLGLDTYLSKPCA